MHINEEIDIFIKRQAIAGKKKNTLKNYKTDLTCFLNYLLNIQQHDDISHFGLTHLLEYGDFLKKKFNSDNSRRRRVQTLRIFFDYLVETGKVKENFVRQIPVSPKFVDIPKPTPLHDIQKVWAYYINTSSSESLSLESLTILRNQIIFLLIYTGGLKVAQLAQLKIEHIISGPKPRVMIFPVKGNPYSIPLSPVFNQLFIQYKKQLLFFQEQQQLFFDEIFYYANPYKIISAGISSRGIELIFKELRCNLEISLLTPKSVRVACIYTWVHLRHSAETIKTWMGVAPGYSLEEYIKYKNTHLYNLDFL